jgi:hypothetical protein
LVEWPFTKETTRMTYVARSKAFAAKLTHAIKSAPRPVAIGAALALIIGLAGAYAATTTHTLTKTTAPKVAGASTSSPTPSPTATPEQTPTETPTPSVKPSPSAALKPAAAKTVTASVPNIHIDPVPAPAPAGSPSAVSAAVTSWYNQSGKGIFISVFNNFTMMGQAADSNDINGIANACYGLVQNAASGLQTPPIPDAALDQKYRTALTQLQQGGTGCQQGIQTGDADMATNGINLLGAGGTALEELLQVIAPGA